MQKLFNIVVLTIATILSIGVIIHFEKKEESVARERFYQEFGMTPEEYMESRPDWGFEER
jgi:hypothetical protein